MTLSVRDIEDRLEEAAITLRRLPATSGPRGYGRSWPDYVQEAKHAYGYHEARMRVVPSAAEIARMEEALDWLRIVSPEDARILWMRAENQPWRAICIRCGCVRSTAWRRWSAGLITIQRRLKLRAKKAKA